MDDPYCRTHSWDNFLAYFSKDYFLIILRCLHFFEKSADDKPKPQDRLFKIRPHYFIIQIKIGRLMNSWFFGEADYLLLVLVFRQYIQIKRHKYRVKLYMLTETYIASNSNKC